MAMSNSTYQLLKFGLVFGVGIGLAILLLPSKRKQEQKIDRIQQKKDAQAALEAARQAIADGVDVEQFESLKRSIQEKYGLRLYYKPQDEHYYVADSKGRDILRS